jgi:MFS family permease
VLVAMLVEPHPVWVLAVTLFGLGVGLGIFTPANNSLVMAALPASSSGTGGGLVNTARGLGTALGVALVTLALQLEAPDGSSTGSRWAVTVLLVSALVMVATTVLRPSRRTAAKAPRRSLEGTQVR